MVQAVAKTLVGELVETGAHPGPRRALPPPTHHHHHTPPPPSLRRRRCRPGAGRDVMLEWGDEGPLRPRHVQEAHRRLLAQGSVLRERPARAFMR